MTAFQPQGSPASLPRHAVRHMHNFLQPDPAEPDLSETLDKETATLGPKWKDFRYCTRREASKSTPPGAISTTASLVASEKIRLLEQTVQDLTRQVASLKETAERQEREAAKMRAEQQDADEKEVKDKAAKQQEAKDKEVNSKVADENATDENAAKDREAEDREAEDREAKDKAVKDKATKDREAKEKEALEERAYVDKCWEETWEEVDRVHAQGEDAVRKMFPMFEGITLACTPVDQAMWLLYEEFGSN